MRNNNFGAQLSTLETYIRCAMHRYIYIYNRMCPAESVETSTTMRFVID